MGVPHLLGIKDQSDAFSGRIGNERMARGKYLSLEEARRRGLLGRFCEQHPSEGDEELFDRLLDAMAKVKSSEEGEQELRGQYT